MTGRRRAGNVFLGLRAVGNDPLQKLPQVFIGGQVGIDLDQAAPQQCFAGIPQAVTGLPVGIPDQAIEIADENGVGRLLQQGAEAGLAFGQGFTRPLVGGQLPLEQEIDQSSGADHKHPALAHLDPGDGGRIPEQCQYDLIAEKNPGHGQRGIDQRNSNRRLFVGPVRLRHASRSLLAGVGGAGHRCPKRANRQRFQGLFSAGGIGRSNSDRGRMNTGAGK